MKNMFGEPKARQMKESQTQKHLDQLKEQVEELKSQLKNTHKMYETTLEQLKITESQKEEERLKQEESSLLEEIETIFHGENELVKDEPEYILLNKPKRQRHKAIEILEKVHNFKYHSMLYMLRTSGSENYKPADDEMEEFSFLKSYIWQKDIPENYNKPFIQLAFLWSHRNSHYQVNENTQKELHSTGLYSYINQNLKTQLNSYYATWPFYFNEKVDNLAEDWMVTLGENGFITADTYTLEDPLSLITNQPKRIGILKRLIRQTSWVLQGVQVMRKTNDKLIKNIEIEISIL